VLTLFTTGKAFRAHNGVIQRNALKSWTRLHPDAEIILFGEDEGAAEVARELGIRHEPHVERNEFGTNRVDFMFAKAQEIARHELVCYVNCDIVLLSDFVQASEHMKRRKKGFLMIGKRWDTDITEELAMDRADWAEQVRGRALAQNTRRTSEVDYFVFPKGFYSQIPPFGIGRLYWDHWLVWKARAMGAPVIDASYAVAAVHQNHDYNHHPQGRKGVWEGEEPTRNLELAGHGKERYTFENATHLMTRSGHLIWTPLRKQAHETQRQMFHIFVHKTFGIRKRLGLRKESFRKAFHGRSS
jgi:hypothetical protein